MPRTLRGSRVVLMALTALTALTGCFSGDAGTTPTEVECDLPLDGTVIGTPTTIVQIVGFSFVPAEVRIPAGTSVTWVYCEPIGTEQHTTTSDVSVFGSPLLGVGDSFTFQFTDAGSYAYHCEPHPFMTGLVIAE